jgi:CysZ protein
MSEPKITIFAGILPKQGDMRFFKEAATGIGSYSKAISFISTHKLWLYVIIPAIINLLIFFALGTLLWEFSGMLSRWLIDSTGADNITGILGNILEWMVAVLAKLITFLLYFKFYRYTILLLSAPALALIAEKTQEILTGHSYPFQVKQLIHDIFRGLAITLKNLLLELMLTIPLYLLAFIPIITPIAGLLVLCIESYFVGFSMLDYRNEFRRLSAAQSQVLIRQHKGLAIGNGLIFNLILAIPFAGVLLAPPLSVVAAGLAAYQVIDAREEIQVKL